MIAVDSVIQRSRCVPPYRDCTVPPCQMAAVGVVLCTGYHTALVFLLIFLAACYVLYFFVS
jgi:hypothetical protein